MSMFIIANSKPLFTIFFSKSVIAASVALVDFVSISLPLNIFGKKNINIWLAHLQTGL